MKICLFKKGGVSGVVYKEKIFFKNVKKAIFFIMSSFLHLQQDIHVTQLLSKCLCLEGNAEKYIYQHTHFVLTWLYALHMVFRIKVLFWHWHWPFTFLSCFCFEKISRKRRHESKNGLFSFISLIFFFINRIINTTTTHKLIFNFLNKLFFAKILTPKWVKIFLI